jgi:hypothetical protein
LSLSIESLAKLNKPPGESSILHRAQEDIPP